ncbi:MAG: hypothetical protein HYV60_12390 [Planctomycetia bacterium]|nr:hypothetical protein [Planctomycetia bacterium]
MAKRTPKRQHQRSIVGHLRVPLQLAELPCLASDGHFKVGHLISDGNLLAFVCGFVIAARVLMRRMRLGLPCVTVMGLLLACVTIRGGMRISVVRRMRAAVVNAAVAPFVSCLGAACSVTLCLMQLDYGVWLRVAK